MLYRLLYDKMYNEFVFVGIRNGIYLYLSDRGILWQSTLYEIPHDLVDGLI